MTGFSAFETVEYRPNWADAPERVVVLRTRRPFEVDGIAYVPPHLSPSPSVRNPGLMVSIRADIPGDCSWRWRPRCPTAEALADPGPLAPPTARTTATAR